MEILVTIIIITAIIYYTTKHTQYNPKTLAVREDEDIVSVDDIVKHYEFMANLWTPKTPLKALNNHGGKKKFKDGDLTPIIEKDGLWMPITKHTLIDNSQYNKEEERNLEFLKKFRKIYESEISCDEKERIISQLFKDSPDIPVHLKASNWFLWELLEVEGISNNIAYELYYNDIKTREDIKLASDNK